MEDLLVLLSGSIAGTVAQAAGGRLSFSYNPDWQQDELAYPLSLSMPLAQRLHADEVIRPFMEGLLPDNVDILRDWGRRFGASPGNPFSMLTHVGEDVAGAAQFIRPDRLDELTNDTGTVDWLSDAQIADRLRVLFADKSAWRIAGDSGYFSLAGAQPKTALLRSGARWGLPSGGLATTHILKPPVLDLEGLATNEHLCLRVAGELGLPVVNSEVLVFGDQRTIVVERYDRLSTPAGLIRIHQEDFCQASSTPPSMKHEGEGGPDVVRLVRIIEENSSSPQEDVLSFIRSLGLHWVLLAPDAHAKNYSLLIAPGGQVRLAPLYDVISVLPYPQRYHAPRTKLAMRIAGEYRAHFIRGRHWRRLADEIGLDQQEVWDNLKQLVSAVPDAASAAAADARGADLEPEFIDRFEKLVTKNADVCARLLE